MSWRLLGPVAMAMVVGLIAGGCRQEQPSGRAAPVADRFAPSTAPVETAKLVFPADANASGTAVVERSASLMGTAIEIMVVAADQARAGRAINAALAEMERVERLISSWRDDSQISALNRAAGVAPVALDLEVRDLLEDAVVLCELTGQKFDITFKGAGELWDFEAPSPRPPQPEAVQAALSRVDCRALVIDREAGTGFLKRKGMAVGLGGIGKGYAVDRAAAVLRENGFNDFVVNAGGDLFGHGRLDGRLWRVSIRHPREPQTEMALLPLSNLAVATSGDYERFFEYQGRRYHHILDPATGFPAAGCQSVTVTAPAAYLADALATGVFVLGPEEGLALIEWLEGIEGAIVDSAGEIHVSSGISGSVPAIN